MGVLRVYHPGNYKTNDILELSEDTAHHICVVLRKKIGDMLLLLPGDNYEWSAEIIQIAKKKLHIKIGMSQYVNRESPFHIHLAQALGKGDKFEFVIQKAVELGVAEITPIISSKSAFSSLEQQRLNKKYQHWQRVVISAIEQCGRNYLPTLHPICHLSSFSKTISTDYKWILEPNSSLQLKTQPARPGVQQTATALIGPEGGWHASEVAQAKENGFIPISLGPRILRTETAPIALLSILQAMNGDLRKEA